MGACQSAPSAVGTDHNFDAKKDVHGERCPTLLELECMIERRRRAGKRVHVNAVNVEFRRGLFEVYTRRGEEEDLSPAGFTAVHPEDERRAFVGTHMETGISYAIREVALPTSRSAQEMGNLWEVLDAWMALDHPNLCRVKELFCSEERYFVVSDLCSGGDVISRLEDQGRDTYEEPEAIEIVRKIVMALRYCHSESVVHGNLCLESCLFEDPEPSAEVRLSLPACARPKGCLAGRGLGVSNSGSLMNTVFGSDASRSIGGRSSRKSIPWYMPPEVRGSRDCNDAGTEAGDMWSLGALVWQIMAGVFPQDGIMQEAAWSGIIVGRPLFKGAGWANRSPKAADFVSSLLKKDPSKRMTAAEALQHPWLRSKSPFEDELCGNIRSSLRVFKESTVIRRLGLMVLGRTLEPAKMLAARSAFRAVDVEGKGYIVEDDLAKALEDEPSLSYRSKLYTNGDRHHCLVSPASTSNGNKAAVQEAARSLAQELFSTIDLDGSGRVGFSAFLGACLAGRAVDEDGVKVAFRWLAKKDVICPKDLGLLTGETMTQKELENAFAEGWAALAEMKDSDAVSGDEMGGFTYPEFYSLIAGKPHPFITTSNVVDSAATRGATASEPNPSLILISLRNPHFFPGGAGKVMSFVDNNVNGIKLERDVTRSTVLTLSPM